MSIHQLLGGQLAKLPAILDSFVTSIANTTSSSIGWEGERWVGSNRVAGSHKVVEKGYVNTKTSQTTSCGAIFTSTYHTKQLNAWPNSSGSCVMDHSWLSTCQGKMEPFEDHPSTHGRLASLRNKPQQKQPGKFSALIPSVIVS